MREAISNAIYTKLNTISGLTGKVYKYNKGGFTDYPVAVILGSEAEKERESSVTILKTYKFKVQVLQEVQEEARGKEDAEMLLLKLADEIDTAFDNDDTLSGAVDDANVSSIFIWSDRELQMRVLELSIECKKLIQLT